MTTASAPGKIILCGEHAVVYGRPALAVPVKQVQATVTVSEDARGGVWVEAPNIGLSAPLADLPSDQPLAAVVRSVFSALGVFRPPHCTVYIQSTIPVASGLGSGAAVSVAVIRALSAFLGHPLPDDQVNILAYEAEKLYHGTPSGIDNTVITYGRPVYFVKGKPIKTFRVGAPFTLLIGDTGVAAPTKEAVGAVRELWQAEPARWEKVFDQIGEIVWEARQAIERGDLPELGRRLDDNHTLLQILTVSSPELDRLVEAARRSGALGAKMSGGGRGGNMLALVEPQLAESVARALQAAGAARVTITTIP
jgi:mevalonate kinase